VYSLSIAVYCTAWTFYGSVGRATVTGFSFLAVYLGPTLIAFSWWALLRKMVRIARENHITSISDFVASRYGKSGKVGALVAFIAIVDPAEPDSGNIYFGDPLFGTLEQMDAFMYAERDFHDQNLPAAGSQTVTVNGIMSAGNQIAIDRETQSARSRLILNFDDRIKRGAVQLPGIPTPADSSIRIPFTMISFREVTSAP